MNITRCTPDHIHQLKQVIKRVYPANPRLAEDDNLNWQYVDSPFNETGDHTLWILEDQSQIKGFYGWVPVLFYDCGIKIKGCEPVMWWVDDSCRGYGLQLLGSIMKLFDCRVYHWCSESSRNIFRQMGLPLMALSRWIGIIRPDVVVSLIGSDDGVIFEAARKRLEVVANQGVPGRVFEIARLEEGDEMMFHGYETVRKHLAYTSGYMNWRYKDIPGHDYRILKGDRPGEFAVFRMENIKGHPWNVMRIIEWSFARATSPNAFQFIWGICIMSNVILMDVYCSNDEIGNVFEQMGFGKSSDPGYADVPSLFRPLANSGLPVFCVDTPITRKQGGAADLGEWYFSRGNGDFDRIRL